jgi:hypothetical protein
MVNSDETNHTTLVASPCLLSGRFLVAQGDFFGRSLILNALAFKINERPKKFFKARLFAKQKQ